MSCRKKSEILSYEKYFWPQYSLLFIPLSNKHLVLTRDSNWNDCWAPRNSSKDANSATLPFQQLWVMPRQKSWPKLELKLQEQALNVLGAPLVSSFPETQLFSSSFPLYEPHQYPHRTVHNCNFSHGRICFCCLQLEAYQLVYAR